MLEVEIFKECFYSGRLLWIRGPAGTRKVRITYELLKNCNVLDAQVVQLDLSAFLRLFEMGIPRKTLSHYRVLIVRGFDRASRKNWERFLHVLGYYRILQFELGVRVILISDEESECGDPSMERELLSLKSMILRVSGVGELDEGLDSRVHFLLEEACRVVGKRISRISESGALFLESETFQGHDEQVFDLLVRAVQNSRGSELTIEDLLAP